MHNFKELRIWSESKRFCATIYEIVSKFPKSEEFGLSLQMRRAVISIPSNIAEGSGRNSNKDFSKFIDYAIGSSYELETQLLISLDLEFISENELNPIFNELVVIQKMLNKFKIHLKEKS